ncbi:FAD-binding protein [Peptococcus simiae]|uniref:FAD-binding protein n=1 Tax=Peptococcus simiae TaxID=1643805 RepID=UPI00397EDCF2
MRDIKDIHYSTDILIVGAGSAGLWAAYSAKKKNPDVDVLICDKGPKNWGGLMSCAGGDLDIVMPDENIDDWIKDWVYYYDGLCDQELMEKIFKDTYDIFKKYEGWGCEYLKDENGTIETVGVPQRGLDHVKLYVTKIKGSGGLRLVNAIVKQVNELGVRSIGRTMLTDLIKDAEGKISGAVGFDIITGDFIQIQAKSVLLATGFGGWKSSYMKNASTGEGIEMAFKAGAELRNMEFVRVWNVPKLFAWEGQTTLLPLGARFTNNKGEDFMAKYSSTLGGNTDPHYTTVAMALETRKGNGPFYLDTTALSPEDEAVVQPKLGWQKINYDRLKELGIDFFNEKTEWMPQPLLSYGGIVADLEGQTRVPGLYAAGRCRSIDPGVYTGGFALATTATTGKIAGESMVDYISDVSFSEFDENEIKALKEELYAPLSNRGIDSKEVLRAIQRIIYPYEVSIVKSEESLENALKQLESLQREALPFMGASSPHYLMKLKEVQAISFITEWVLKASLLRKESRCGHFREDYPDHLDEWLKWIVIGLEDEGKVNVHTEDVPLESYKFDIERYYQDNFDFKN